MKPTTHRFLLISLLSGLPSAMLAQPYGMDSRPSVGAYLDGVLPTEAPAPTNWTQEVAFPGLHFDNAMGLLPLPGTNKLVVWEREGRIYQFENNPAITDAGKSLMLDISNQCQGWDDMGLLNIAFHPDFLTNRHIFVFYTWVTPGTVIGSPTTRPANATNFRERLSRFTVGPSGLINSASEVVIIDQGAHNTWHNGGGLFFHPENGFLYLTNGNDNKVANDQVIDRGMFGGVIRIDVDKIGGSVSHPPVKRAFEEVSANWPQYYVPNDNPFVGVAGAIEELYAIGLRSPHRMTYDPPTRRIFIADVGGGAREEINVIEPTDPGGLNFQWSTIEGYNGDLAPGTYFGVNKRPILDYPHNGSGGRAVIGGYVYRGTEFPELYGKYIFTDNVSRRVWYMDETTHTATTPATPVLLTTLPRGPGSNSGSDYLGISSIGRDANNELYFCQMGTGTSAVNDGGRIYKLARAAGGPTTPLPIRLSDTGAFTNVATLNPSPKLIPYELNAPFWSDGAVKSRWAVIPDGTTVDFTETGDWTFPTGSVLVKHFELPTDDTDPGVTKRLETRLLVRTADGASYGATYKWRGDQSDADLIESGITEDIPIQIASLGPLTGADLGSPATTGSTSTAGDAVTITAGGTDIWGTADQGHFASQLRTGDFDISVRVESLTQANLYTKAGLMARESLSANSKHVFALVFPSNASRNNNTGGYEFQYRATTGGTSAAIYPPAPQPYVSFPSGWVRLRREGDTFSAYSGNDGISWTEIARKTLVMPQTLYFGYVATAHASSPSTTAVFHPQTKRYQPWYFPSRTDCVSCHNPQAGGGVLGLNARQLNKPMLYPASGVTDNELRAWSHAGLFSNPPQEVEIPALETLAPIGDISASLEKRARSYLDTNCSYCHRPGGVQAFWDARYDTPLLDQGIIYGEVGDDLGVVGARVVTPQDLSHSILYQRVNRVGANQMPPISRNTIDTVATDVLSAWIQSLAPLDPPQVALTEPAPDSTFMRVAEVPLSATASDSQGIARVEYHQGDTLIGSATEPPFSMVWSNPPLGDFPITATAYGTYGNSAQTDPVTIHLINPPVTFERHINFQTSDAPVPTGYQMDDGSAYSVARGYGWSRDNTVDARWRTTPADLRYATLVHLQKTSSGSDTSFWEMDVPNGYYDIHITAGDADHFDGFMHLTAEGADIINAAPTAANHWVEGDGSVMVTDGKLTIAPGTQAVNSKISFIDINRISIPPSVALTGLPANPGFLETDAVTLAASASDSDGSVSRVEFWDGNVKLGEDSSPPYSWSWNGPLSAGAHLLKTIAYDDDGRVTSSASISVEVMPLKLDLTGFSATGAPMLQTRIPAGRNYTISYSGDLDDWQPLQTSTADGTTLNLEDGSALEKRFYRLSVDP